jgi:hypothetical protein
VLGEIFGRQRLDSVGALAFALFRSPAGSAPARICTQRASRFARLRKRELRRVAVVANDDPPMLSGEHVTDGELFAAIGEHAEDQPARGTVAHVTGRSRGFRRRTAGFEGSMMTFGMDVIIDSASALGNP